MSAPVLTEHLLNHYEASLPYTAATQHAFLADAGAGTLPPSRLALWLSQDRIYAAHAYPRFIGRLIASIPFSTTADQEASVFYNRVLRALVGALDNIVREVDFFDDISRQFNLNIDQWRERKGTRDYTAEMARVSSESLSEGLVFLWAMEKVYLDAWRYASSQTTTGVTRSDAVTTLIQNWTSPEFEAFVAELGGIVDGLHLQPGTRAWKRAEEIWERVIELEIAFWPKDGEEETILVA